MSENTETLTRKEAIQKQVRKFRRALSLYQPEVAEEAIAALEALCPNQRDAKLLKAEYQLAEYYLYSGEPEKAEERLLLLRDRSGKSSLVFFESTILLIVIAIRKDEVDVIEAELRRFFTRLPTYKTPNKRPALVAELRNQVGVEALIATVRREPGEALSRKELVDRVIDIAQRLSEEQLLLEIGSSVPKEKVDVALRLTNKAVLALPPNERMLLSSSEGHEAKEYGELTVSGFERMLWRFLCAPNSAVHKLWLSKDSQISQAETVVDTIVQILGQRGFQLSTILINIVAFILKKPAQTFCDRVGAKMAVGKRARPGKDRSGTKG
jgi:hypothetical protein